MNVGTIKDIVTSVVSMERTGYELRPEQYNEYLQKANYDLFNQSLKKWEEKQVITDILNPFKVKTDLVFTAGTANRPADYARFSNAYYSSGDFNDWFLPSMDELGAMYTNLYVEGVGGFGAVAYWGSSEVGSTQSRYQTFATGFQGVAGKNNTNDVRACRSFTAGAGDYVLRDTGPAGGLIFYISGTTFYEAAPSDQSTGYIWSNIDDTEIGAGAQGTAVGTGQANTTAIIAQAGHTDSAAKLCDDLISAGGAGATVPIEMVTDTELPDRLGNAITSPTTAYPIICSYDEKINIFPASISTGVYLLYIKKPTIPVYTEKVENDINVYDSVNSTQIEFDEIYHPDIIRLIIGNIGIDVKDELIIQAIDREKQENIK